MLLEAERRAIVTARNGMSHAIRLLPIEKEHASRFRHDLSTRGELQNKNATPREDETVRRGPLFAAALRAMRTAHGVTDGDKRAAEKEVRANVIRHRSSFMTRARGLLKIRSQMSTISKAAMFLPVHTLAENESARKRWRRRDFLRLTSRCLSIALLAPRPVAYASGKK